MENVQLVHQLTCDFEGEKYLVEDFRRPDGSHFARTIFSPQDVIICDGVNLDDVLLNNQDLIHLAIHSRRMQFSSRLIN